MEEFVWAINKKLDGAKRKFSRVAWDLIKDNPNSKWIEIGTPQPITAPTEIEEIKKKAVDVSIPLSMPDLRKALKGMDVKIPKYAKKVDLIKLYNDNRKQED